MTASMPPAFLKSAAMHVAVVGVLLLFGLMLHEEAPPRAKEFELVMGSGDNYAATVAPSQGDPSGVKIDIPVPPPPAPAPVVPPKPEPAEVTPAPPPKPTPAPTPAPAPPQTTKAAPAKPGDPAFDMAKHLRYQEIVGDSKAKQKLAKEKAEEAKRQALIAKAEADKKKALQRLGIKDGAAAATTASSAAGAGGKALTRSDGSELDAYFAMLKQKVGEQIDRPSGIADTLVVTVTVTIMPSGRLSGAKVTKSSGSDDFDHAVIAAFNRVQMPAKPDGKEEVLEMSFRTRDIGGD